MALNQLIVYVKENNKKFHRLPKFNRKFVNVLIQRVTNRELQLRLLRTKDEIVNHNFIQKTIEMLTEQRREFDKD